ncbi:MAG: nucleoside 2-deoxyribosyltransferase [Proteobacteria bacterium]|nr:nucleoside 2-deoxyribosyltransferase [Pseudomonadota bacterium]
MPTCFVIQPFDRGKFDKRFEDTFRPAIEETGLEPYRVDQDPKVEIPIESIEEGIRDAAICLADITTDNPNVWYELGYAFAAGKAVIMVCSDERREGRYPFDIQHRTIVGYKSESSSDFEQLKEKIKERIHALMKKGERLRELAESDPVALREGLSQPELAVLATLAGDAVLPDSTTSVYSLKHDVERAGFTSLGFGLGLRRLLKKGFIKSEEEFDEHNESYPAARLTQVGWDWVEANERMFSLKKGAPTKDDFDDDIPF